MKTDKFQRKPFLVDAVQVTEENMEDVAKWCKGVITQTDPAIAEQLKKPVQTWIQVETQQPMNDRQKQAFVGDWILFANRGFKIYAPKAFERTFDPVFQEKSEIKIHVDEKRPTPKDVPTKPGGYSSSREQISEQINVDVPHDPVETVVVQQKGTNRTVKVSKEELAAAGFELIEEESTGQARIVEAELDAQIDKLHGPGAAAALDAAIADGSIFSENRS